MNSEIIHCLISGTKQTQEGCGALILKLSTNEIKVCREKCPIGRAKAAATPLRYGDVAQAAGVSARDMILAATDCRSDSRLAKKLGFSQPAVSLMFRMLAKGERPTGPVFAAMLRASGHTAEQLLACSPMTQTVHNAPPAAETPAPESAPAKTGTVMMGTPSDDALCTAEQLNELAAQLGKSESQVCEQDKQECIPDDFEAFLEPGRNEEPLLTFNANNDMTINACAVRTFGLDQVERIGLLYSRSRGQLAIRLGYTGPGSRKLRLSKRGFITRLVNSRQAVRQWGLAPERVRYPITQGQAGLLIVSISAPMGGEA